MNLLLALVILFGAGLWLIVAAFIAMPMFLWSDVRPRPLHGSRFD